MPISDLMSRLAVLAAIDEFNDLGRDGFLEHHRFQRSTSVFFRYEGRIYDARDSCRRL